MVVVVFLVTIWELWRPTEASADAFLAWCGRQTDYLLL
jgi:hypothetical protein